MTTVWDTAQVCKAGHMVNCRARQNPEKNEVFCTKCGQPTLLSCPACDPPHSRVQQQH